jgi:hypothetical protein
MRIFCLVVKRRGEGPGRYGIGSRGWGIGVGGGNSGSFLGVKIFKFLVEKLDLF